MGCREAQGTHTVVQARLQTCPGWASTARLPSGGRSALELKGSRSWCRPALATARLGHLGVMRPTLHRCITGAAVCVIAPRTGEVQCSSQGARHVCDTLTMLVCVKVMSHSCNMDGSCGMQVQSEKDIRTRSVCSLKASKHADTR